MFENAARTELSEMGEFGLIQHISQHFQAQGSGVHLGIGDDCAVINKDDAHYLLVSSEQFLEGVHFDLTFHPLKHLGYKLVTVGISDVLAMNGKAEQIIVILV